MVQIQLERSPARLHREVQARAQAQTNAAQSLHAAQSELSVDPIELMTALEEATKGGIQRNDFLPLAVGRPVEPLLEVDVSSSNFRCILK